MRDTIHIVFGFDQNYAMPCGVAILSVCRTTPGPICFHGLIADDVKHETKERICDMVAGYGNHIEYQTVDQSILGDVPAMAHFSRSVYNRLLIPEVLSTDLTKAIYLDSDIVVLRSLRPLWEIELGEDEPAAMAPDSGCSNVVFHNNAGIPLSDTYFNSGVILFNLSCWRRESLSQKCIRQVNEHTYPLVDQDAINAVIGSRVSCLPLQYNAQLPFFTRKMDELAMEKDKYFHQVSEARENPVIIHYVEGLKPWHEGCPLAEEWLAVKALSPWKDFPLARHISKSGHVLHLDKIRDIDVVDVESIAQPMLALALRLASRHRRLFIFLRKCLWKISRKMNLLNEETNQ